MPADFTLEIFTPAMADVYLACAESQIPWSVVERLDRAGVRVVGDACGLAPDDERLRRMLGKCSGVVAVPPAGVPRTDAGDLPVLTVSSDTATDLDRFIAAVLRPRDRICAYAFMIGRLERDFRHARDAIRIAVEAEAGMPCLWADDGRHRTNIESVRERTRLLIKHATFVIGDLSLGAESPERENPSRAHEIGMAIAYERPLMLSSQEPRRYPYFSIGDMQMTFWSTEDELEAGVRAWIRANRESVARRVLNYRLRASAMPEPVFTYDPRQRYVGPNTRVPFDMRRLLGVVGLRRS